MGGVHAGSSRLEGGKEKRKEEEVEEMEEQKRGGRGEDEKDGRKRLKTEGREILYQKNVNERREEEEDEG